MTKTKNLIIFGAGNIGRETACLVQRINQMKPIWKLLGFVDDTQELDGHAVVDSYTVLGSSDYFENYKDDVFVVCALGEPTAKKLVVERLREYSNIKWATLIDPDTIIMGKIKIGGGCLVFPNTTISTDVSIGNHVLVYYNTSIAHDVKIGDYSSVNHGVNISGNVDIGYCSRLGVGSKTIEKVHIGDYVMVGAGAVVINDISDNNTVVGVPAKSIIRKGGY